MKAKLLLFCYCGLANTGDRLKRSVNVISLLLSILTFDFIVLFLVLIGGIKITPLIFFIASPILIFLLTMYYRNFYNTSDVKNGCVEMHKEIKPVNKVALAIVSVTCLILVISSWFAFAIIYGRYLRPQ